MSNTSGLPADNVELSPASTTVAFEKVIPPQRIPIPAGVDDDQTNGRWVLGFADDASWRRSLEMCNRSVFKQCEMGARMGCSIRAAKSCRKPWWKQILLALKLEVLDEVEREACEEREMAACVADAKEACRNYARDTCSPVYADARIAVGHEALDPRFRPTSRGQVAKTHLHSKMNSGDGDEIEFDYWSEVSRDRKERTNYRGGQQDGSSRVGGWSWNDSSAEQDVSTSVAKGPEDGWEGGLIRPKLRKQTAKVSSEKSD